MAPKVGISDIRRDQLTRSAMKCIVIKGYDRVTLDDVTQEAGLSKGIASYYFKNREQLLLSVIRQIWEDTITLMKSIFGLPQDLEGEETLYREIERSYANPKLDLIIQIRKGIKPLVSLITKNPDQIKVIFEFLCQIPRNPVIAEMNHSMQRLIRNISAIGIAEGIKRGIFKKRDPQVAAYTLLSTIFGFAISYITDQREFDHETFENALRDLISDYLLV